MSGGVCFRLRVYRGWWVFGLERIDEVMELIRFRRSTLEVLTSCYFYFFGLFLLILLATSATATATHIPHTYTC